MLELWELLVQLLEPELELKSAISSNVCYQKIVSCLLPKHIKVHHYYLEDTKDLYEV